MAVFRVHIPKTGNNPGQKGFLTNDKTGVRGPLRGQVRSQVSGEYWRWMIPLSVHAGLQGSEGWRDSPCTPGNPSCSVLLFFVLSPGYVLLLLEIIPTLTFNLDHVPG
jgi:hypothetical protein